VRRPAKDRGARAVRLVGYLNHELEPAARVARLVEPAGYAREGPGFEFTLLMGESPTWSGPMGLVEFRESEKVGGEAVEVVTFYGVEWDGSGPCRLCGSTAELPPYAACLHCCRTGRDAEIGHGHARRRDRLEASGLKGGTG
jgi:hypothetical protein